MVKWHRLHSPYSAEAQEVPDTPAQTRGRQLTPNGYERSEPSNVHKTVSSRSSRCSRVLYQWHHVPSAKIVSGLPTGIWECFGDHRDITAATKRVGSAKLRKRVLEASRVATTD
jgi:hypothetical protein